MQKLPKLGKIHPEFFNKVIYPRLGKKDRSVIVGPQHGVDFGAVKAGSQVIVLSTDPFYIARELGIERAAWFAVHIIASDVAVSGIPPKYLAIDLNLPPEMREAEIVRMWKTVHAECRKLGISIVTGHTARYAGCNYPMVGGATAIGIGDRRRIIVPRIEPGDRIIVTKGPAIETTGLMAAYFPEHIEERYGRKTLKEAKDVFFQMSTVADAAIAASTGGVTAMHDATECGVFGGLYEMAAHSNVGLEIHKEDIMIQDPVAKTCACFGIDPYCAISEGTLLASARKGRAAAIVKELAKKGIPASIVGQAVERNKGIYIFDHNKKTRLFHPRVDPFWSTFEKYLNLKKK